MFEYCDGVFVFAGAEQTSAYKCKGPTNISTFSSMTRAKQSLAQRATSGLTETSNTVCKGWQDCVNKDIYRSQYWVPVWTNFNGKARWHHHEGMTTSTLRTDTDSRNLLNAFLNSAEKTDGKIQLRFVCKEVTETKKYCSQLHETENHAEMYREGWDVEPSHVVAYGYREVLVSISAAATKHTNFFVNLLGLDGTDLANHRKVWESSAATTDIKATSLRWGTLVLDSSDTRWFPGSALVPADKYKPYWRRPTCTIQGIICIVYLKMLIFWLYFCVYF